MYNPVPGSQLFHKLKPSEFMAMATSSLNWRSYLIELIIVTLGIVMALALTNWNETRKEKKQVDLYLQGITRGTISYQKGPRKGPPLSSRPTNRTPGGSPGSQPGLISRRNHHFGLATRRKSHLQKICGSPALCRPFCRLPNT